MLVTHNPRFENANGSELTPGRWDCLVYAAATVALLAVGILGARGAIPPVAVGGSFLALTIFPPLLILCGSKNAGAWCVFITCITPLFAGLGGTALAGRISPMAMSGITLGVASLQLVAMSAYAGKVL